jgi:spore germination protein YaaH
MIKKIFISLFAVGLGFISGFLGIRYLGSILPKNQIVTKVLSPIGAERRQVIGFLPYWLINNADKDYTKYLTTLSYFGLTIDSDGSIKKYNQPGETEPGWYGLNNNDKLNNFFETAKKNNINLSLVVFSSNEENIDKLISSPVTNGQNLVLEVEPIMKKYGFTDLNLDVESALTATEEARKKFTSFIREVKKNMDKKNLGTLTIDVSPIVLIKKYLVNVNEVAKFVDQIVFMTYDYHYFGSAVTGPVAPVGGAGIEAEFDTEVAIKEALKILPFRKIILGVPLYGYEWETLGDTPRSGVIPGTGIVASNKRVEKYLATCQNCRVKTDKYGKESYFIYKDEKTGTYHQIFYPDKSATEVKVKLAKQYELGGIALWALGYDGATILDPLLSFY